MDELLENESGNYPSYEFLSNIYNNDLYSPTNCSINNSTIIQSDVDYLKMTDEESLKLMSLLKTWDLSFLHQTCVDSLVDVEALKYHDAIRSLKSSGLIETSKKFSEKPSSSDIQKKCSEVESNIEHYLNSLKHDNCKFKITLWNATVKYRLNSIRESQSTTETLLCWSSYKLPVWYKLVDIDFNNVFPNVSSIMTTFPKYVPKLVGLFKLKIKDSQSYKLLENLNVENLTENGRDGYIFYLLHALFVPTSKKSTRDDKGKKSIIKYSIRDSQQSFIIITETASEVEDIICRKKDLGNPIQPFIIIVCT